TRDFEGWFAVLVVAHADLAEADPLAPACADGLHEGFLGGEAGGEVDLRARLAAAIVDFGGGENAGQKLLALVLQELLDAGDFHDVSADAQDGHARSPCWGRKISGKRRDCNVGKT